MSIYNSAPLSDDEKWSTVKQRYDAIGDCKKCGKRKVYATVTIYGDGTQSIKCHSCGTVNQFEIHDEEYYDDATRWKPLGGDEQEGIDNFNANWEQANKRGKRKK